MADFFDPSRLFDPSSYLIAAGKLLNAFSYKVKITSTHPQEGKKEQFITVISNEVLTEEQILETAETYGVKYGGTIETSEVTGAYRSRALGE